MISSCTNSSSHYSNSEEPFKHPDEINAVTENQSNSFNQFSIHSPNHSINNSLQLNNHERNQNINFDVFSEKHNDEKNNTLNDTFNKSNDKTTLNEVQAMFNRVAHISEFLANAELDFPDKKSNPCFQMLSNFFEVFNEQLRINFKIKNKLNEEIKRNPIDPKKVDKQRQEIELFLKEFREIISTSKNDYAATINTGNIQNSFNNIISIIQKGVKKTAKLKKLAKEIENKKKEIASINIEIQTNEKILQEAKNGLENRLSSIQKQINESHDQIMQRQAQIDEITPDIATMKIQIQNEAYMKQNLSEMISKRKNQIEIAQQSFFEVQNKQKKKLQKLGEKLSKLKIERRQLLIDEQPLISALEDAESELKTTKNLAESEIISLNEEKKVIEGKLIELRSALDKSQKEKIEIISALKKKEEEANDCSLKYHEANENIKILSRKIMQIYQVKKNLLHKLNQKSYKIKNKINMSPNNNQKNYCQDLNLINGSDDNNNENVQNYEQRENNNENQNPQEIDDLIFNSINEELAHLEDSASQYKYQIEETRKENSLIRSKIRVNKEKISKLIAENQKIATTNLLSEKEVEKLSIEANAQKQRFALFKSTMNEYERMRKALGFHSSMLPSEVAKHTVSMIRSWKQVEFDEEREKELNEKISLNSINEEFKCIFGEINDVESKLYGTNP